jgi:uncharacterized protein YjiS (DUF1127 family)
MLPPSITPERPYPCDARRQPAARASRARLAASIARLVEVAIRKYRSRRAMRAAMELDDQLLRDIGVGRGESGHGA